MRIISVGLIGLAAAALLQLGAVATARADLACKQQAKDDYRACKQTCKDDYRAAKLTCRNVDPTCGTACLAGRQVCRDDVDAILSTGQLPGGGTLADCADGTDGCRARLADAKDACGAPCNGDPTCDACVDAAQVTSFICRDTCRESWRADPTVAALETTCHDTFQSCIHACPPAP
jgi:hypothetical protein